MKSKLSGRTQLLFNLPSLFDPQWLKDGLREKPPSGTGLKAYWAMQIIAAIPLQEWSSLLGNDDPFSLAIDPDWSDTVMTGWQKGAALYPDTNTLAPLLKRLVTTDNNHTLFSALELLLSPLDPNKVADLVEPLKLSDKQRLMLLQKFLQA